MEKAPNPLAKSSNAPYLITVVLMTLIGMIAVIMVLWLRPDSDNTNLIAILLGMIVPTTASIMAIMKSQETHLTVNSQLAQWKEDFSKLMRAEGAKEAVDQEQARVANLKSQSITEAALRIQPRQVAPEPAPEPAPILPVQDVRIVDQKDPVPVILKEKPK